MVSPRLLVCICGAGQESDGGSIAPSPASSESATIRGRMHLLVKYDSTTLVGKNTRIAGCPVDRRIVVLGKERQRPRNHVSSGQVYTCNVSLCKRVASIVY